MAETAILGDRGAWQARLGRALCQLDSIATKSAWRRARVKASG